MNVLENMDDEVLSVKLLKQFNDHTKKLGTLLMNRDPNLSHAEWKVQCDDAKKEVDQIVSEIMKNK